MHIAIVGLGNIGSRVATNLTAGAVNVIVSDRDLEKARDLAKKLGPTAVAMTIDAALKKADIVILSILFDIMKKFVVEHRADLAGKIVVDPSNPIAPDGEGFKKIIPADQSAGKIIADLLPEGRTRQSLRNAERSVLGGGSESEARARCPFLCDGLSSSWQSRREVDQRKRLCASQCRRHRSGGSH